MKRFILLLLCFMLLLTACNPSDSEVFDDSEAESSADEPLDEEAILAKSAGMIAAVYPRVLESQPLPYHINLNSVHIETYGNTDSAALKNLEDALIALGVTVSGEADVVLHLGDCADDSPEDESYAIKTAENAVFLASKGSRGQIYAVNTFLKLLDGKNFYGAEINDYPATPVRGVVEGFYGVPWSFEDRISIIEFCGDMKMNTYIYAPKDDLKHRSLWREAYTAEELINLKTLVNTAISNGVDFVYALSPGLDMDYSQSGYKTDFAKMMDKFESMYEIGVRNFALFLDDLPSRSAGTAANHAKLVNDFREQFYAKHDDIGELMTVFVEYFDGYISDDYSGTLAAALNSDVYVMWTGADVTDAKFNSHTFDKPNKIYDRKMLLWWNYPVNDYAPELLLMDGIQGMNANVFDALSGFISNPMNQAEASKIPLFTIADFIWNPKNFASKKSYTAAFNYLHPEIGESLKIFSEVVYAGFLNDNVDSAEFRRLLNNMNSAINDGKTPDMSQLNVEFQKLLDATNVILVNEGKYKIIDEIKPWVIKARAFAQAGILYCGMIGVSDMNEYWIMKLDYFDMFSADFGKYDVSRDLLAPFFKTAISVADSINGINYNAGSKGILTTTMSQYLNFGLEKALDGDLNSFFWSACTPSESSDGGSFTIELEKIETINNIYLAMGVDGDKDRFYSVKIEVSKDNSNWTQVYTGKIDHEFYLDNINTEAKYIKVTSIENTNYWVKLRSFEINGERFNKNITITTANAVISSSLNAYQENSLDKAVDSDDTTYFWSDEGPSVGSYIQLDLGEAIDVFNINIDSGIKPDDYFRQAHFEYSLDGVNWITLEGIYTKTIVSVNCNIKCRYVRYVSDIDQMYWVTLIEFSVNKIIESENVFSTIHGNIKNSAYMCRDGDFKTCYIPITQGKGELVVIFEGNINKIEIYTSGEPNGAKVYIKDFAGNETEIGEIDKNYNCFETDFKNAVSVVIKWETGIINIHEIVVQ